ncbi:uncharacterized protein LOC109794668, partial [Cajanus cajan]|uniref:uncharacterized protein LOC109794668 n=1 Tax=Cajanus cajan TaxID=3821 RepID=UPI00098D877E
PLIITRFPFITPPPFASPPSIRPPPSPLRYPQNPFPFPSCGHRGSIHPTGSATLHRRHLRRHSLRYRYIRRHILDLAPSTSLAPPSKTSRASSKTSPSPPLPNPRRVRISTAVLRALGASRAASPAALPPGLDQGVVVYFTSLRVVRRTFDDCRAVRSILRGLRVAVDERDVSIDDRFRDELHGILGRRSVALPRVFIGGVYIGGADEVRQLHESGELQRLIERLPRSNQIGCDCCGGFRFLMCDECNGSHKVFTEKTGFRSCSSCNANGLIRCPACFFVLPRHTKSLPPQLVTAHKQL